MLPSIKRRHGLGKRLRSPSKLALIGLNLVLYFLLLRWVGENIQPGRLADYFRQVPAWALLGSLSINLTALALYGTRMALLLGRDFRTAFSIINIGYALNTLLPLRLGEAIKIYLSHRLFGTPLTGIFAASVAEKLIDLAKILLLGAIVVVFAAGEFIQTSALLSVIVLVAMGIGVVALFHLYIVRIVKLLPRGSRLRRISIELHKHASGYPLRRILAVTTGIWILNIALVFFSFNTYLPEVSIGILDAIALLLVLALAIAIPSAPAGLGLFEAGIVAYLTQKSGVGNEAALAAAVVFHLVITLPQLVMTGWLLRGWGIPSAKARA
jgi:uncharacterized protein (TIRG00374 family)